MKELYPLFGIVTVLNTPFTTDDKIDISALRANVAKALAANVAGFLVPAMAAEVYKLSHSERLSMVDAVLAEVNGRVPVIAGAGETDPQKCRDLLQKYIGLGCKAVLFQLPYTDAVKFKQDFMQLAEIGPDMIMLQDWDASGYGLPNELILELFEEVPAFRCLKVETVPAGPKYSEILTLTNQTLNVSGGWAVTQMIEGLDRGVHAFMPTAMHIIYSKIYRYYHDGERDKAERLFGKILPVLAFSNQHLDISIHFFKRLLYQQGIYPTPNSRNPMTIFDAIHEKTADRLIKQVMDLENELAGGFTNA
jgi:4-hydroxy-tetrahydrodipicolinate synthase